MIRTSWLVIKCVVRKKVHCLSPSGRVWTFFRTFSAFYEEIRSSSRGSRQNCLYNFTEHTFGAAIIIINHNESSYHTGFSHTILRKKIRAGSVSCPFPENFSVLIFFCTAADPRKPCKESELKAPPRKAACTHGSACQPSYRA